MAPWTVPDEAATVMSQEFKVDDRCQLFVDVPGAQARLRPGPAGSVEVSVAVSDCPSDQAQAVLERLRMSTRQVQNTVRIRTDTRQQSVDPRWWAWVRESRAVVHLDIRIPARTDADIRTPGGSIDAADLEGDLVFEVAGGTLTAQGLRGRLEVQAFGSDVTVREATGPKALLSVAAGRLTAGDLRSETIEVRASGAPVTIDGLNGPTDAVVHGAPLSVHGVRAPLTASVRGGPLSATGPFSAPATLRASGGSLDVFLPDDAGADLTLEGPDLTVADALSFEGTREPERISGTIGAGGPALSMQGINGPVRCRPRSKR
jgi:hypothetical protein